MILNGISMSQELLTIPISPGEMLDKITILEIKSVRISDQTKLLNVSKELHLLDELWSKHESEDEALIKMRLELRTINEKLWDIEDDIRDEERNNRFGERFIELARLVYFTNDKRADVKKQINLHLNSDIVEEKSYQQYS